MTNNVNLTTAMRSNVLLLQDTSSKLTSAQQELSTGLKINSALDGPSAYFAAQSLNQRASDLSTLKNAMGQAIDTINAGNQGISSIQSLVTQAQGLVTSAYSSLGTDAASIANRASLAAQFNTIKTQIDKIATDSGYAGKNMLVGSGIVFDSTATSRSAVNSIVGLSAANTTNVVSSDTYTIKVQGDGSLSGNATDITSAENAQGLVGLKISGTISSQNGTFSDVTIQTTGSVGSRRTFTITDGNEARTIRYFANQQTATAATSTASTTSVAQVSTVTVGGTIEGGDIFSASVAGQLFTYTATSTDNASTIATVLQTSINSRISSGVLSSTVVKTATVGTNGTVTITGATSTTTSTDFTVTSSAADALSLHISQSFASGAIVSFTVDRSAMDNAANAGDTTSVVQKNVNVQISVTDVAGETITRSGTNTRGDGKLSSGENAFAFDTGTVRVTVSAATVRQAASAQSSRNITTIMEAAGNTANDLTVQLNETNTNSINVQSQNVKTDGHGLGIDNAQNGWMDRADIDTASNSLTHAISVLRSASQSLSTNLNIITTRESFTSAFSNVLTDGANKLTLADQNQVGADVLMLQTQQQLGTVALSLANQSQQSILKLF